MFIKIYNYLSISKCCLSLEIFEKFQLSLPYRKNSLLLRYVKVLNSVVDITSLYQSKKPTLITYKKPTSLINITAIATGATNLMIKRSIVK